MQFVQGKGKSVSLIISTYPWRNARAQRDTSTSLERFIDDRYSALTMLPQEDMSFAAELWPQLEQRTRYDLARTRAYFRGAGGPGTGRWGHRRRGAATRVHAVARLDGNDAVISVKVHGEYFPLFQFGSDDEPLPVIARLNALWPPRTSGLAKAAWLLAPNPNLRDAVPADLLRSDPDRVVQALELEHSSDPARGARSSTGRTFGVKP